MNTGSGKTVVGLIILKSCLNEEKGPAVFVVPDSYLVQQVCREAKLLGVSVTTDPDDISFLRKQAILVINIHTLVNGKSKFGMRPYNNIDIGSIIIVQPVSPHPIRPMLSRQRIDLRPICCCL